MNVELTDTHAHIHFADYKLDPNETWQSAVKSGVTRMIAVGCRIEDSRGAIDFAKGKNGVWASVGIHPHEATDFLSKPESQKLFEDLLSNRTEDKVVAIGECGLDYFYNHSVKEDQVAILRYQLELAQKYELPVMFHIRDAFADFWPIYDDYSIKGGVVHSFTGTKDDVEQIMRRNLYIGLNGIMTFTKQDEQLEAAKSIPLDRLVLETDAPYLTPKPFRGKICKPEHVVLTAEFLADLRGETLADLANQTTLNARRLLNI